MVPSFEYLVQNAIETGECDQLVIKSKFNLCCLLNRVEIKPRCPWRNDLIKPSVVFYLGEINSVPYYVYLEQWGEVKGCKSIENSHIHVIDQYGRVTTDFGFMPLIMLLNPAQFENS